MVVFQHGDVVLVKVTRTPKEARKQENFNGVLQEGEHTGHAHRLYDDNKSFELYVKPSGERYLRLLKETPIRHEEHQEINLPSGDYEVRIVREYDHLSDLTRPVID